jgi:hypothetical protein
LIRELVCNLDAWDLGAEAGVCLQAGLLVSLSRIRCETLAVPATAPYLAEFECSGRTYICPLYLFQARTQTAELEFAEALPERKVAVG